MKDQSVGILAFIAQLVSSVAWPLTLLVCVLLLRRHLLALIPLLRTVKYSDVEIRFGREVAEVAASSSASSVAASVDGLKTNHWDDLMNMSVIRPRTAIRRAFKRVEDSMLKCAQGRNVEIADEATGMPMIIGAVLLRQGIISTAQYDLLSKLRTLVHEAELAPPDSISPESAAEFISLSMGLAASIG